MALPVEKRRYTPEEYFAREAVAVNRHEFHDGDILEMAGASYAHSKIALNIAGELRSRLRGTSCEALDSNIRIMVPSRLRYVYPDVTVVCGGPQFDPRDSNQCTITNPRLVIEVLSDSTESYDRGAKFDLYRQVRSVEEYVLVSQHQAVVESFFHQPDASWLFNAWKGPNAGLVLRSLRLVLPLAEIYEGLELPSPEDGSDSPA